MCSVTIRARLQSPGWSRRPAQVRTALGSRGSTWESQELGAGGWVSEDAFPCNLHHRVPRGHVLPGGSRHQLPRTHQETPRHIRPVLQPRPEGPAAPLGLSLENKPGSCLVSSHPWLQLPEGMPPAARPGPVRTRVCHHRHAQITCVRHHRHTRTRVCVLPQMRTQARAHVRHHRHGTALAGLLLPWGPWALLGQDTHLSEHPYICICPCNLPAAETPRAQRRVKPHVPRPLQAQWGRQDSAPSPGGRSSPSPSPTAHQPCPPPAPFL